MSAASRPLAARWSFFWARRDVVGVLTRRILSGRYHQTLLGVGWAVVHPLLAIGVFTWVFSHWLADQAPGGSWLAHNALGWVPWGFFTTALSGSAASLVGHADLLHQVALPRLALPLAVLLARCVDLLLALVVVFGLLLVDGTPIAGSVWLVPLPIVGLGLQAVGAGMMLAYVEVRWRDVGQVLPYLLQLGVFVTPVVVPAAVLAGAWPPLPYVNPAWGHVEAVRGLALGHSLDPSIMAAAWAWTALAIAAGAFTFRRTQQHVGEWL
ncbi:MAG: ABC transporter permease [Planctomycetes bacterium]|nr:ABC transporter permease [Planctomycetota bacterium]MCB9824670.1 ABC transporter permease [Planctomycetota bacterium]MCB9830085.1 ABC transporter permease [Planctomycetota bacterium]MCB9899918.1 ABC transporter permease [Planctomycetota bacterium]